MTYHQAFDRLGNQTPTEPTRSIHRLAYWASGIVAAVSLFCLIWVRTP